VKESGLSRARHLHPQFSDRPLAQSLAIRGPAQDLFGSGAGVEVGHLLVAEKEEEVPSEGHHQGAGVGGEGALEVLRDGQRGELRIGAE